MHVCSPVVHRIAKLATRLGALICLTVSPFVVVAATNAPPGILVQPANAIAGSGEDIAFAVTATDTNVPALAVTNFQWRFNGGVLGGANVVNQTNGSQITSTLIASNLSTGTYSVAVANTATNIVSSNAVLFVVNPVPRRLGTGLITTGIKRGLTPPALVTKAINVMRQLNTAGAELAERGLVRAATDVTGFGLLGHLGSICRASGVGAELQAGHLPIIGKEVFALIAQDCIPGGSRENLKTAGAFTRWNHAPLAQKILLTDAQTSGGLLLCVPPRHLAAVLQILQTCRTPCAAVIGRMVRSDKPRISVLT